MLFFVAGEGLNMGWTATILFFLFNIECHNYTLLAVLRRNDLTTLQGQYNGVQDAMTTLQPLT